MAIRAVTFDFWMTLFEETNRAERHQVRVDGFCAATGADPKTTYEALNEAHAEFFRIHVSEQRTLAPGDAVQMVCDSLGLTLEPTLFDEMATLFGTAIFTFPPTPISGALDAVRETAARVPVGLISDSGMSPGTSLRRLLDGHGFTPYFTTLTFSDELGVAKPQAEMFTRTASSLGVAPDELLHLGDLDPTDIVGVQAVGGAGALFTGSNDRFADTTSAEYRFGRWSEYLDALPTLL